MFVFCQGSLGTFGGVSAHGSRFRFFGVISIPSPKKIQQALGFGKNVAWHVLVFSFHTNCSCHCAMLVSKPLWGWMIAAWKAIKTISRIEVWIYSSSCQSLRKGLHLRCTKLHDSPGAQLCLACLRPAPAAKLNLRVQRLGADIGHAVLGCNLEGWFGQVLNFFSRAHPMPTIHSTSKQRTMLTLHCKG